MELTVRTTYDTQALTTLAKGMRKTVRRKRNVLIRLLGGILVALNLALGLLPCVLGERPEWDCLVVALFLLVVLLFDDRLNGWVARQRLLPGTEAAETTFGPEGFEVVTAAARSTWNYATISAIWEDRDHIVLLMGKKHGQVVPKNGFLRGTPEVLKALLTEKTGLPVQR